MYLWHMWIEMTTAPHSAGNALVMGGNNDVHPQAFRLAYSHAYIMSADLAAGQHVHRFGIMMERM